jgi:integrase
VRFSERVDQYVQDQFATGRFNSPVTERDYRYTLGKFAEHVGNRDPRTIGRDEVKSFLLRWRGNTRALHHSHLVSFWDWNMEEGLRRDNPARQVRRTKTQKPNVYRLTRDEVRAFRAAARDERERTVADLGLLAGLRATEILGLQGRHFRRRGWVWVSPDIAKGKQKGRDVRVLPELQPTWERLAQLGNREYAVPRRQFFVAGLERRDKTFPSEPSSYDALRELVLRIGARAGIAAPVTPHLLRHAYADHIVRFAGIEIAKALLGHESINTTQRYAGHATLDEIAAALEGFGFGTGDLPPADRAVSALPVPAAALWPETRPRDLERAAVDLGAVLCALKDRPGFREAARDMAHG